MELLYVYADRYRVFQQEEFSFSDKYRIHYDPQANILTIEKNENYFDFFPGNISGISAIIGKNASGKSSLLSLIGAPDKNHKEIDHSDLQQEYRYFMIFLDTESEELLLECFGPEGFHEQIKKSWPEDRPCHWNNLNNEDQSCWDDSASILFRQNYSPKSVKKLLNESAPKNRRNAPLQGYRLLDTIRFLREQTYEKETDTLYQQYPCIIQLFFHFYQPNKFQNKHSNIYSDIATPSDIRSLDVFNPLYLKKSFGYLKIHFFQVAIQLINYLIDRLMLYYGDGNDELISVVQEKLEHALKTDSDMNTAITQILTILYASIRRSSSILGFDNPRIKYFMDKYSPEILVEELSRFFGCNRIYKGDHYSPLNFLVDHNEFFDFPLELLDDLNDLLSETSSFLSFKVARLSDGEQAYLAMYSSIHEQISMSPEEKKHFILLFDEIERCMHPEMCRTLISNLIGVLSTTYPDKSFQIIISSHSPFIVGDLRKENLIQLEAVPDSEPPRFHVLKPEKQASSFGQNIHTLLKSQFFLDNTFSKYACTLIGQVSQLLQRQKSENEHHWLSVEEVREELLNIFHDPKAPISKKLPSNEEETIHFLQAFIEEVGEPMLQKALRKQLNQWCLNCGSSVPKQMEIDRLKAQLRELGVTAL